MTTASERKWFYDCDFVSMTDVRRLISHIDALVPYHDELLKIAKDVGESDDPFAAWETVNLQSSCIAALEAENAKFVALAKEHADRADNNQAECDALEAERDTLKAELAEAKASAKLNGIMCDGAQDQRDQYRIERDEARRQLEEQRVRTMGVIGPFAKYASNDVFEFCFGNAPDEMHRLTISHGGDKEIITVGHFRAARALATELTEKPND